MLPSSREVGWGNCCTNKLMKRLRLFSHLCVLLVTLRSMLFSPSHSYVLPHTIQPTGRTVAHSCDTWAPARYSRPLKAVEGLELNQDVWRCFPLCAPLFPQTFGSVGFIIWVVEEISGNNFPVNRLSEWASQQFSFHCCVISPVAAQPPIFF